MTLKIRKLEKHIGAEIQGVDITASIDVKTFEQLRHALCEYAVLVFHDQDITDEQHATFSENIGIKKTRPREELWSGLFLCRIKDHSVHSSGRRPFLLLPMPFASCSDDRPSVPRLSLLPTNL